MSERCRRGWGRIQPSILAGLLLVAACGGGGGGGSAAIVFELAGTSPANGSVEADIDSSILVTFTLGTDLATVNTQTVRMEEHDGRPVAIDLLKQSFDLSTIQVQPRAALDSNELYRVRLAASIRSADGVPLGREITICFITGNDTPTVRPDQLLDLGDRLQIGRYLARGVQAPNGRYYVFGGWTDADTITDRIEVYDPGNRSFRLLDARMNSPRAEHSATLMKNGRILLAGGIAGPGGDPIETTEIFSPATEGVSSGPDLMVGRRRHGASGRLGGASVLLSGGIGIGGDPLDSIEFLDGGEFRLFHDLLAEPSVDVLQVRVGYDKIYFSPSNVEQRASVFDGSAVQDLLGVDIRFRAAYALVDAGRYMIVGGDTRSIAFLDGDTPRRYMARDLLNERRGAHTVTPRGQSGALYLVAGGFNIASNANPALDTLEVVEYFRPSNLSGTADALAHRVENVRLPVPFAGHVGFTELEGPTVLAGGFVKGGGPHSRRVVVILDDESTPSPACDPR